MVKRSLAILAVATAPLVGGCGADDVNPDAVASAAEKTVGFESFRIAFRDEGGGEGTMLVDTDDRRTSMEMDVPGVGMTEVILDGTLFYVRLPEGTLPDGKRWVKGDLGDDELLDGINGDALFAGGGVDPAGSLQMLFAMGDLEQAGEEEVRGVPTTRYEGTVDLAKVADAVPEADRAAVRKTMDALIEGMDGETTIPTEVWIDETDQVRRVRQTLAAFGEPETTTTMDFYDFGVSADVELPAADETLTP